MNTCAAPRAFKFFWNLQVPFFWVDCWSKIVRGLVCRASAGLLSEMSRGYKDDIGGAHLGMVRIPEGLGT